ncbi:MAG: hydrolase [Candidatus Sericytochromatia bacterium]|nr:MAG: hydrolase [Candidatus Sericytochromatia bacterium]
MTSDRLFVPSKQEYVRGKRPNVKCILCSVVNKDPKVDKLDIYSSENFIISVNLYPYNPGHLMIFPKKHIESVVELNDNEVLELHKLQVMSINILKENYNAQAFNIGYNIGLNSGASIEHLHLHIVPRYPREVGFIDVISGTRIIVEDPINTVNKLKKLFNKEN